MTYFNISTALSATAAAHLAFKPQIIFYMVLFNTYYINHNILTCII